MTTPDDHKDGLSGDGGRRPGDRSPLTRTGETEKAMVERHLREGTAQLARQREIVDRQPPGSVTGETSRKLLRTMERTQEAHRTHLDRINRRDSGKTG